jgi:hypothetical protein
MEAENARPLTKEEVEEAGFSFSDPTWEIAYQLREISGELYPLRWRVQMIADEIPKLTREITEALRILGQTVERATAPWYVRIFWRWHRKKQEKQTIAGNAEMLKRQEEQRRRIMEITKKGDTMRHSRFAGRY